ncbi:hypothetical protein ACE6H2_011253 [Prunus campanulata]
MILADWAYGCYKRKKLHMLLENDDEAKDDMKKMEMYLMIAFLCIQEDQTDWAYDCYKQNKLYLLLENDDDEAKDDMKKMEMYLMIAFWCIQGDPSLRLAMKNVTQMLEGTIDVSIPPNLLIISSM